MAECLAYVWNHQERSTLSSLMNGQIRDGSSSNTELPPDFQRKENYVKSAPYCTAWGKKPETFTLPQYFLEGEEKYDTDRQIGGLFQGSIDAMLFSRECDLTDANKEKGNPSNNTLPLCKTLSRHASTAHSHEMLWWWASPIQHFPSDCNSTRIERWKKNKKCIRQRETVKEQHRQL